jgi:hypothetical protein
MGHAIGGDSGRGRCWAVSRTSWPGRGALHLISAAQSEYRRSTCERWLSLALSSFGCEKSVSVAPLGEFFSEGPSMLRRFTQSMFGVSSARPRRARGGFHPVAALESLEDRALLSATCVTTCVTACAPTRCTTSFCAPPTRGCNTGGSAVCFSISTLLCAIQKFEQTLCHISSSGCQIGPSCSSGQKSCDPSPPTCSSNGGGYSSCGPSHCAPQASCGTRAAA